MRFSDWTEAAAQEKGDLRFISEYAACREKQHAILLPASHTVAVLDVLIMSHSV